MNFSEYLRLNEKERVEKLWTDGVFLLNMRHKNHIMSLYSLYGFYVEVMMDINVTRIINVIIFEGGKRLEKYVKKINLDV